MAAACGGSDEVISDTAAAAQAECSRPELAPAKVSVYWESFTAYRQRQLTVKMRLTNDGGNAAADVTVMRMAASGGAEVMTGVPLVASSSLGAGNEAQYDIKILVPQGVSSFRLDTYMSAKDPCDNSYDYPPPGGQDPAGATIFPPDSIWHTRIDSLPVDPDSDLYIQAIGPDNYMHHDFGSGTWDGGPIGIPFVEVPPDQPRVNVTFEYDHESDAGPYPIPPGAPIEGGPEGFRDRHVIVLDRENQLLYELFYAWPQQDGGWTAVSGAVFDTSSHALRPDRWTSADAAGLPIYPGLVQYNEVASGRIEHPIRFTAPRTRRAYIWPARHFASDLTGIQYPPMGQRFRLKADFNISGFSPENQVILTALKEYGLILADNGAPWYISGVPDERWDNDDLHLLQQIHGSDFEAVDTSSLMIDPDSGQARQ